MDAARGGVEAEEGRDAGCVVAEGSEVRVAAAGDLVHAGCEVDRRRVAEGEI